MQTTPVPAVNSHHNPPADTLSTSEQGWLGPAMVLGFGVAVVMWCAAFLTHLPAIDLPARIAGPAVIVVWLIAAIAAGATLRPPRAPLIGGVGGFTTALLGVLILGALLTEAPEQAGESATRLRPDAAMMVPAFLITGAAIGAAGGFIGSRLRQMLAARHAGLEPAPASANWLARFGVVTCLSVTPLLLLGGLVTSTGSGMAVPDWPGTYEANMFLYPIALMADPRIFLEHSHRLFGALVGLTTLALMLYTLAAGREGRLPVYAAALFLLVVVQGVLGGTRVLEKSQLMALGHGVLAQVFFALLVIFAACLTTPMRRGMVQREPVVARLAGALVILLFVQLLMGATYRHLKVTESILADVGLWGHVVFSIVVVGGAVAAGFAARRPGVDCPRLRKLGMAVLIVTGIQFLLGWSALFAVLSTGPVAIPEAHELADAPPVVWQSALIATAHQANGALLLALASLLWIWGRGSPITNRDGGQAASPAAPSGA